MISTNRTKKELKNICDIEFYYELLAILKGNEHKQEELVYG
jgi:hypothetical protein